jgi:SAM-dependent methyltransferase
MENYQKKYLDHIGMGYDYNAGFIPCEICGDQEFTVIRETIDIGKGVFGKFPVVACNTCGLLYQNPRFEKKFYEDYYSKYYRRVVCKDTEPSLEFVEDQIKRGELLFETIKKYIDSPGTMLDVGCSVGGILVHFIKKGWNAFGVDPDQGYVRYGREKLGLPIENTGAEEMVLEPNKYDLIIIMDSLEHVYDPNLTLELCRKASRPNAFLLLEGRGIPQKDSKVYFNHNHHRYFSLNSFELMMFKHGWKPVFSTEESICETTQKGKGAIYCMGQMSSVPERSAFDNMYKSGKREDPQDILKKFDEIDRKWEQKQAS